MHFEKRMRTMDTYKVGIAAVIVGTLAYLAPLTPAWTLAAGILPLSLGSAAIIQVLKQRETTT